MQCFSYLIFILKPDRLPDQEFVDYILHNLQTLNRDKRIKKKISLLTFHCLLISRSTHFFSMLAHNLSVLLLYSILNSHKYKDYMLFQVIPGKTILNSVPLLTR
jgi:hypothetical protein